MIRKVCFFGPKKKAFYANWIGFTNLKSVWTGKKSVFCNSVLPYPIPSYQIPSLPTRILNTILHLYKILLPYTTLPYHIEIEPNRPTAETSRIGTPSKFTQAKKSRPKRPKLCCLQAKMLKSFGLVYSPILRLKNIFLARIYGKTGSSPHSIKM